MKRTSFCLLVLEVLVHLQKTIPLQLLQHYCSGHSPGLLCLSMVWLGNEQQSFCHFWDCMQALHFRLFCWLSWLFQFFLGILAQSSRYTGHLNQIHPFKSVLVCWFLKCRCSLLPSPVWPLPICLDSWTWHCCKYCCLQHRTLLLSPVTSTAGYCFCFGSIPSFFLELFLHSSPVAYWAPGEFPFQYPIILPFHTVHGVLKGRILKWFAMPFSSGPHSVRPLQHDLPVLGVPTGHGLVSLS